MEASFETVIKELKLDKRDWVLTKFGDIALQQKQKVDRENTNLKSYVKGEHMASEDIHLRQWGELKDEYLGPAFIRRFDKDDILYGSRRTYLKKVVIAPFSGITSNTTFVIKANEEKVDKRLLPFIMLSEGFTENSIRNSKGSVNPYINWKDIAKYEFLLPPKEQQEKITKLLLAADETIENEYNLLSKLNIQLKVEEKKYFYDYSKSYLCRLGSVVEKSISGGTPNTKVIEYYTDGVIPWITTKLIIGDQVNAGEKYITDKAILESPAKVLMKDNIVCGTRVGVGKFSINDVDISFSQDVTGLMVNKEKIDIEFLIYQLNSSVIRFKITPFLRGTTIKGITKEDLLGLKIYKPSIKKQIDIKNRIQTIKNALHNASGKNKHSKVFQKSLINQVF